MEVIKVNTFEFWVIGFEDMWIFTIIAVQLSLVIRLAEGQKEMCGYGVEGLSHIKKNEGDGWCYQTCPLDPAQT